MLSFFSTSNRGTRTTSVVLVVLLSALFLMLPMGVIEAQAGGITEAINSFFFNIAMMAGGIFVTVGGWALEMALEQLVFGMGALMAGNNGIGVSVNTVWVVVRDGFNLLFIFGLIFIGLKLIWNSEDSAAKGTLSRLIVAALLINFSLFIAKFIVDFSNIAALQIYDMMSTTLQVNTGDGEQGFDEANVGITGYVMHLVGLQTIAGSLDAGFGLAVAIFIFLLFTGLVFLAGALMLVTRFVMLCFYMIFAPVMFLGWILPKLKHAQDKWWNNFLRNAFFAPAYLFCLYIALRVLAGARTSTFDSDLGGDLSLMSGGRVVGQYVDAGTDPAFRYDPQTGAGFEAVLLLIMALGFMIAAILVASRMSIHGADTSMAMLKGARSRIQRYAGNATSGVAARVGRNTVGAGANKLANSAWMNRNASRFASLGGRQVHQSVKNVADSSFDARQVKVGSKSIGNHLDIGEGKKGGFVTRQKEDKKIHDEYLKSLKERDVEALEKEGKLEAEMARVSPKYVDAQKAVELAAVEVESKKVALDVTDKKVTPQIAQQEAAKKEATIFETETVKLFKQQKAVADAEATTAKAKLVEIKNNPTADPETLKQAEEAAATAQNNQKVVDNNLQQANDALAAKEKPFVDNIQGLTAQLNQAKKDVETAETEQKSAAATLIKEQNLAKANVKFENQMNYIKSLENSAARWDSAVSKLTARNLGTAGGAAVGGAVGQTLVAAASGAAVAAAVTAGVAAGTTYAKKDTVAALRKDWGASGEKKMKEKDEEKQLSAFIKKIAEQSKEEEGAEKKPETAEEKV